MARRLLDIVCALVALILTAPLLVLAAVGIKLSSPGPVLFRTRRVGQFGRQFIMLKLRTMHLDHGGIRSRVTGARDPRIFPFGQILRRSKIDELPQLINILLGHMAIVGPRPEVPGVVARHYTPLHRETLNVRPGLTSPGSLYHYTCGEHALTGPDPEARYFDAVLPLKLALDIAYVRRATLGYDLMIMARTFGTILDVLTGRRVFAELPEMADARSLVMPARNVRMYTPAPVAPRPPMPSTQSAAVFGLLVLGVVLQAACLGPESPPLMITWTGPDSGGVRYPTRSTSEQPPMTMLLGAGDIGACDESASAQATAALLDRLPGIIFTTGNHVADASRDEAGCYQRGWGKHRQRIRPVPGDRESAAYYRFFGASAGTEGEGYYSYDTGSWHVIALNSTIDLSAGSAQIAWLREDLIANRDRCTVAYWHHPRFASSRDHGDRARTQAAWDLLYDAGVEIVLNGHEQHYERFAPQAPDGSPDWEYGIRQFIVGTGGESDGTFGITVSNSERRRSGTPGVLVLMLRDGSYDWRFVPAAGESFIDSGSGACHDAPPWAPRTFRRRQHVDLVALSTEARLP